MVFNTTFNNISAISWQSALEKTTDLPQVTDKLYHIMLYSLPWAVVEPTTSVVIGTDCIGSCKSNYHTITATTSLKKLGEYYLMTSDIFICMVSTTHIVEYIFLHPLAKTRMLTYFIYTTSCLRYYKCSAMYSFSFCYQWVTIFLHSR